MRVVITTDGSKQSMTAARVFKSFTDPEKIEEVVVLAVIRPFSAVAFADEVSGRQVEVLDPGVVVPRGRRQHRGGTGCRVRGLGTEGDEEGAVRLAGQRDHQVRHLDLRGLVVVAAGGRGLSDSVLVGSTAQRVQHYAPCPVLVVRPQPRPRRRADRDWLGSASMELLRHVLVFLHFLGWAALFGAMVVQLREPAKRVTAPMRDGIGTAFLAGLLVVGVLEAGDHDVNHTKVAVKFGVGLVILVLVMANMRRERIADGLFYGILGLTVLNIGVAVFWR